MEVDQLAIGLTRPTMYLGIDMRLLFALLVLTTVICLDLHTVYGLLVGGIGYLVLKAVSRKEPRFCALLMTFFYCTMPNPDYLFWGRITSYAPY